MVDLLYIYTHFFSKFMKYVYCTVRLYNWVANKPYKDEGHDDMIKVSYKNQFFKT